MLHSRQSKVIIASSGVFLISMCVGGLLMFGSVIAFITNTSIGCNLFIWMLPVGFALLFGWVSVRVTLWFDTCQKQKLTFFDVHSVHYLPRQGGSTCFSQTNRFNSSSTLIAMLDLELEWYCWVNAPFWRSWWDFNLQHLSCRRKVNPNSHFACSTSRQASHYSCTMAL